jgi:hypothetical protein
MTLTFCKCISLLCIFTFSTCAALGQTVLPAETVRRDTATLFKLRTFFEVNRSMLVDCTGSSIWAYRPNAKGELKMRLVCQNHSVFDDTLVVLTSHRSFYATSNGYLVRLPRQRKKAVRSMMLRFSKVLEELNCLDFENATYTGENLTVRFLNDKEKRLYYYNTTNVQEVAKSRHTIITDNLYYMVFPAVSRKQ